MKKYIERRLEILTLILLDAFLYMSGIRAIIHSISTIGIVLIILGILGLIGIYDEIRIYQKGIQIRNETPTTDVSREFVDRICVNVSYTW